MGLSDFAGASKDISVAERHFGKGTGKRLVKARLMMVRASLWSVLGRSEEAACEYAECLEIYEALGDREAAACMQINLGSAYLRSGKGGKAIQVLQKAATFIVDTDSPAIAFAGLLNLAVAYCEVEDADGAEVLVPRLADLVQELEGDREIHVKWLVGSISRARRDWEKALRVFLEVRGVFAGRGEWVHYVESSLDIARVYLARGDWLALGALIRETRVSAGSMRAEDECLQALSLLEEAISLRALGQARLRALGAFLAARSAWRGASP